MEEIKAPYTASAEMDNWLFVCPIAKFFPLIYLNLVDLVSPYITDRAWIFSDNYGNLIISTGV